jgi:ankyrin repeat protein
MRQIDRDLVNAASKDGDLNQAKRRAIEEGANMHVKNWEGWKPLHLASREGNESILLFSLLLEKGAHVDAKDMFIMARRHFITR